MKTYMTFTKAVEQYNIESKKLQELVDQGEIRAALLEDELIVLIDDVRAYVAERDVTRDQFKHLENQPIILSEAARKYRFNTGSLWRWIGKDQIRILKRDGYRVFLNEADVAYARALADAKKLRSGQSLF